MPLTPQEELELQQLQAELMPTSQSTSTTGLTPAEQAEFEQLRSEFGGFDLPVTTPEIPQTPQFQMPQSALQQQLAPDRALSAALAGQLGGARALTQLVDVATAAPELEQQLMQEQIKVGQKPTPLPKGEEIVGQTFEQVPVVGSELRKGFEFQAQTPAEQALELTSGLLPLTPKKVPQIDDIAKAAKQRVQQFEAIDDIARVAQKHGEIPPEFTVASQKVQEFAASEALAAQKAANVPGAKLKQFYNAIGKKYPEVIYGKEAAKNAKTLDTKLTRLENKIAQGQQEVAAIADQADVLGASAPLRSANKQEQVLKLESRRAKLLKDSKETFEGPAYNALRESKRTFDSQTMKLGNRDVPVYRQSLSAQGAYVPPSEIEELSKARETKINPLQRLTMDQPRIMQMMDGNIPNGPMFELNIRPALEAERSAVNAVNAERSAFNQIAIDTGVAKANKQRLSELFRVADGTLDPATANITEQEQKFLNYMAGKYHDWLSNINSQRAELGYNLIKPRKNYITHLQEAKLFDDFGVRDEALDGATKWGPKLKARFRFEQKRLGANAVEDPLQAFDAYIEPAMRQIYTTKPAAVLHARAKFIADPTLRKMQQNFIETRLLGGMDPKDRTLYEYGLGPVMQLAENLTGRFAGGVILGNAKVLLQQFSQVANTIKDTGLRNSLIGLGRAVKEVPPEIASRSDFLTSRRINDDLVEIPKGLFYKPNKFLKTLFEYVDKFVAKQSWQAGFAKGQEIGLNPEMTIKYADDVARQLHGSYSKLYKTELNSGKFGKVMAPLQSFGFNLWNYIVQDTKLLAELNDTSRARELMKTFAAMYVTDEVYDAAGLPAPFGIRIPKAATPEEVATSARELVFGVVPFGRSLEYGIPSPVLGQAVKEAKYFAGVGNKRESLTFNTYALVSSVLSDDLEKRDKAAKELVKFGVQFVPGGAQAYKTISGIQAAKDGFVELGDRTVLLTDEDRRLAPILGPYAVPTVRRLREQKQVEKFRKQFEVK
jgi:hypothetical protein